MLWSRSFPFFSQHDAMDCGPACLRMVAKYYGLEVDLQTLRLWSSYTREGVSLLGISRSAERLGFRTMAVKIPFDGMETSLLHAPLPCIIHWNNNHFIVVYKVTKSYVYIADPGRGKTKLPIADFKAGWLKADTEGIALLLDPTTDLGFRPDEEVAHSKQSLWYFMRRLFAYKTLLIQFALGLVFAALLNFLLPFITQALVDHGINRKDLQLVFLLLMGQLMIFIGQTVIRFIQNRILVHVSIRVNVGLIQDFLHKLMKMPLGYFDTKNIGDLLQRVNDHNRIESFLTQSATTIVFSIFTLVVYGMVLLVYDLRIFLIFTLASVLYVLWIYIFLKKRAQLDYRIFRANSDNQTNLTELIQGMSEIKLQGSQNKRTNLWYRIQARLFNAQLDALNLSQSQEAGAMMIQRLKDVGITYFVAKAVMDGNITIGGMMAVQFIVGQLNGPVESLIQFSRQAQDARLSIDRLNEINNMQTEDHLEDGASEIPFADINLTDVSFKYSELEPLVLKNVFLQLPKGKITAIVGSSGSGKTTLVKMLLGFYHPVEGKIMLGNTDLKQMNGDHWRSKCGAVLQDGYIFSDTIANNIGESDMQVDLTKVKAAAHIANIDEYVEELPTKYSSMIGSRGSGLSQGQRQRVLIARAVYKNPEYLFFDEATNSLDANNERIITENLKEFYADKTVVIVAHRLSTVMHADQIVVLEKGEIIEIGTHKELTEKRGAYYTLVKNQLELGT